MKVVKITDEDYKIVSKIADREGRFKKHVLSKAVRNYAKLKKVNFKKADNDS